MRRPDVPAPVHVDDETGTPGGEAPEATPAPEPAPLLELRDGLPPVVDTPEALAEVVRQAGAPVVVETPGGREGQAADIAWLKENA